MLLLVAAESHGSSRGLELATLGALGAVEPVIQGGSKSADNAAGAQLAQEFRGDVVVGGATITGGTISSATNVVTRMRMGLRSCYVRGLAQNPNSQGRIDLWMKVGSNGQVEGVSASQSGNLPGAVVTCVTAYARGVRFSPPEGGQAVISVPITFEQR